MPIESKYDQEKRVLIITLSDDVSLEDLDELYQGIVGSSEHAPDVRSIWDFRKMNFAQVNRPFIKSVFAIRKKYPTRGKARAAFVAAADHPFGMTRMYEILSSFELPQQIVTFRDYGKAEEWILTGS